VCVRESHVVAHINESVCVYVCVYVSVYLCVWERVMLSHISTNQRCNAILSRVVIQLEILSRVVILTIQVDMYDIQYNLYDTSWCVHHTIQVYRMVFMCLMCLLVRDSYVSHSCVSCVFSFVTCIVWYTHQLVSYKLYKLYRMSYISSCIVSITTIVQLVSYGIHINLYRTSYTIQVDVYESFICLTCQKHTCDMSHFYVGHVPHRNDMSHVCLWHVKHINDSTIQVIRYKLICITYKYKLYDTSRYV